ncbi:glycerol-3-phosphate 1-O-acyltransferase PlsY [Phenylobacterium terrae]|uniref:Glycerol-3-phosphate acyltransferase n=1 Tax=Phenylobacterium terrae TaxID=2665495 RepID=A0ABW4N448_9CAUL
MAFWIATLAGWCGAYLLGSIPTAYLAGRMYGLDIRERGSKSVGATNALRVLGKAPALVVLLVDVLKGAAAIVLVRWLCSQLFAHPLFGAPPTLDEQVWTPWAVGVAGLAALLGHSRSVWLKFSGGKSVATGLGVVLALSWPVALGALALFGAVTAVSRRVSLGSISAALAATLLILGLEHPTPYRLLVVAGAAYVIVRHRENIRRLIAGTEPRIGQSLGR